MAEVAVVKAVARRERKESERILALVLPHEFAAQLTTIGLCVKIAEELFPFLVARNMPTFWGNALVVLVLDSIVHLDIFCRRLFSVFIGNVQSLCPCVQTTELCNVRFIVVRSVATVGFEAQVFCHPNLVSDLNGAVRFAIAGVRECSVLELGFVFLDAVFVRRMVQGFGRILLGFLADSTP